MLVVSDISDIISVIRQACSEYPLFSEDKIHRFFMSLKHQTHAYKASH